MIGSNSVIDGPQHSRMPPPKTTVGFASATRPDQGHAIVVVTPLPDLDAIRTDAVYEAKSGVALMKALSKQFGKLIKSRAIEGVRYADDEPAKSITATCQHVAGVYFAPAFVKTESAIEELFLLASEAGDVTTRLDSSKAINKDLLARAQEAEAGSVLHAWALAVERALRDLEDYNFRNDNGNGPYKIEKILNWD